MNNPHAHVPKNVNTLHKEERDNVNAKVAVWLTTHVGSMITAYAFVVLAIIGLFAILGLFSSIVAVLVAWVSQTLIQLVLLPVILVGQNVLSRHAELLAEEQYRTTKRSYYDLEQIMRHMHTQDEKLSCHTKLLKEIGAAYLNGSR